MELNSQLVAPALTGVAAFLLAWLAFGRGRSKSVRKGRARPASRRTNGRRGPPPSAASKPANSKPAPTANSKPAPAADAKPAPAADAKPAPAADAKPAPAADAKPTRPSPRAIIWGGSARRTRRRRHHRAACDPRLRRGDRHLDRGGLGLDRRRIRRRQSFAYRAQLRRGCRGRRSDVPRPRASCCTRRATAIRDAFASATRTACW